MSIILEVDNLSREYSPLVYRAAKALRLQPLMKRYSHKVIKAVDDISFKVRSGEICGFLGPNGAGKSTTMKAIMGLIASKGDIKIDNVAFNRESNLMSLIGGFFETPVMYNRLTGRDNLKYYALLRGDIDPKRIDEVLKIVGLYDRANDKFGEYSMGMRQRLGIAQAIMHRPKLLLLDEPTNGLDPQGIIEIRGLLKALAKDEGAGILVSSHQLSEIQMMCDRVIIMSKGKIIAHKTIEELAQSKDNRVKVTFITDAIDNTIAFLRDSYNANAVYDDNRISVELPKQLVPEVTKELLLNDITIWGVDIKEQSLEEIFVELTRGQDQ